MLRKPRRGDPQAVFLKVRSRKRGNLFYGDLPGWRLSFFNLPRLVASAIRWVRLRTAWGDGDIDRALFHLEALYAMAALKPPSLSASPFLNLSHALLMEQAHPEKAYASARLANLQLERADCRHKFNIRQAEVDWIRFRAKILFANFAERGVPEAFTSAQAISIAFADLEEGKLRSLYASLFPLPKAWGDEWQAWWDIQFCANEA